MPTSQRLLVHVLSRALQLHASLRRQTERLERFLAGVTLAALEPQERVRLTVHQYSARSTYLDSGLFDWEQAWFAADLPHPPARVLVGGAGSGREVEHLLGGGYDVVAFEPAASLVHRARRRFAHPRCLAFLQGSYEDLVQSADAQGGCLAGMVQSMAPYDAVLLGWGSFTHISTEQTRLDLLRLCRRLCPSGPVLLSFWIRGEAQQPERGRAWRWGWRMGCVLAGTTAPPQPVQDGEDISSRAGFVVCFTPAQIESLAARSGWRLAWPPGEQQSTTFPHATLWPADADASF